MKRMLAGLFLVSGMAGSWGATATNEPISDIFLWAQDLKFSLSGSTQGDFSTNGIIARTRGVPLRITSRDIVDSLSNQSAYLLERASRDVVASVTTNNVPDAPDIVVTNYVSVAYLVSGAAPVVPSYSAQARLMLLEPLGVASQLAAPMVVVRDGNPPVDFVVDQYFELANVFPVAEADFAVVTGKFDVLHELASVTRSAITAYAFSAPEGGATPITFNVGGYTTERVQAVILTNTAIDSGAVKSLNAAVAGTGNVGASSPFCVLRGSVSGQGGKLEIR
jgi:hypothetical protein